MLIYLDTNIYMDYFENRVDKLRPLGDFAFNLLRRCFECEFSIASSVLVAKEAEYNGHGQELQRLNKKLKRVHKLIKVDIKGEDKRKAHLLKMEHNISFNDALHAVLAAKIGADFLVTRNTKHFCELQDVIEITLPESI